MAEEAANLQIAYDALSEGLPLYRAGLKDDVRDALAPYFLLTNRRVLVVVNVGEDDIESIPEKEALVAAEFNNAGDNVEVIGMCVQLEAEAAAIEDPGRARRDPRGVRARRRRAVPDGPQRLPPARPADVLHDRREGVPGVDVLRRARPHRCAPAASTPTSSAGSSRPR